MKIPSESKGTRLVLSLDDVQVRYCREWQEYHILYREGTVSYESDKQSAIDTAKRHQTVVDNKRNRKSKYRNKWGS